MRFNDHSEIYGKHAFLSPSSSAWLRYDQQKLRGRFHSWKAALRGTDLHDLAHEAIRLGVLLDPGNEALATYVLHALEFGMSCEVPLYYSENCFGHADTLSFKDNELHVHDLKTGITPSKMEQLKVYSALFCLEYGVDPREISIELRIYQREEMYIETPEEEEILHIMGTIVEHDHYIESLKEMI